jgi:carboxylesterase
MRFVRRSSRTASGDVKKSGAHAVGYQRTPLRAALSVERFGATVTAEFAAVKCPVLVVRSADDNVVRASDANTVATALAPAGAVELTDSYHLVPLDNDAGRLAEESIGFVTTHRVAENV